MALKCRACRECNGIACRGEIPGVGGKGTGSSFIHNVEALARIRINMDVCAEPSEISTEAELLGMKLSMPVFAAPCAGIQNNYGYDISEYDYSCQLLDACESLGIRGFTGDGIDPVNLFQKPAQAVNDHHGHGIVTYRRGRTAFIESREDPGGNQDCCIPQEGEAGIRRKAIHREGGHDGACGRNCHRSGG